MRKEKYGFSSGDIVKVNREIFSIGLKKGDVCTVVDAHYRDNEFKYTSPTYGSNITLKLFSNGKVYTYENSYFWLCTYFEIIDETKGFRWG
jgi:hypothetical protein